MPVIDETGYHLEPLKCIGCEKLFSMTVRTFENDDKRYCANCWYHVTGLQEYINVQKSVDPITWYLMNTPILDVPIDMLEKIGFVDLKFIKNLEKLRKENDN